MLACFSLRAADVTDAAVSDWQGIACYGNPEMNPKFVSVEAKLLELFRKEKIEVGISARATVWVSVRTKDYSRARALLLDRVQKKVFEPGIIYVSAAWKKRDDGVNYYDYAFAEEVIRKETEPNQQPERNAGTTSSSTSAPPPGVAHP